MRKLAKVIGILIGVALLAFVALLAAITFMTNRSERAVKESVAQLPPGTPFITVVQRLGQPSQTFTNQGDFVPWLKSVGVRVEERFATDTTLHAFIHRGPPFRYILVFTDPESQLVVHATWWHM